MKLIRYIFLFALITLISCSEEETPQPQATGDIYFIADINTPKSRVEYDFAYGSGLESSGNIRAVWQKGDIIKVYETDVYGTNNIYSDIYHDYAAYNAAHPYPAAPEIDTYYRFVCVGGEGTTRGVFKYVGLATAVVEEDVTTHIRNVNVEIKYNHAFSGYWNRFQGLVIYGTPLRNQLMRTQVAKNDLTHLRFGERMYGYICAHNFRDWYDENPDTNAAGADGLVLQNVESCIYRIIIGGIDTPIYGGSTLSLNMPGVTDQAGLRGEPMSLTLGNSDDHQLDRAPWSLADPDKSKTNDDNYAFCAYIVGWPGTLPANQPATITLTEFVSGNKYTWELTSPTDITFEEDLYYTIDLRDHEYTKTK